MGVSVALITYFFTSPTFYVFVGLEGAKISGFSSYYTRESSNVINFLECLGWLFLLLASILS